MKKLQFGAPSIKYTGKIFTISQRPVVLPDGTKATFEYCARPSSVSVMAFNDKKELLLIQECRAGNGKVEWFLPTGQMDKKDEPARVAAQRELREETGYAAKRLRLFKKSCTSDKVLWDVYVFVATGLYESPLPADPGEMIVQRKFFPLKTAARMAIEGEIENEFVAYAILRVEYLVRAQKLKLF